MRADWFSGFGSGVLVQAGIDGRVEIAMGNFRPLIAYTLAAWAYLCILVSAICRVPFATL
jgi:hypothetical protein